MAPINVTTSKQQIQASVADDKVTATVSAGFGATGPQGPSGVIEVTAPITNAGTTTAANVGLSVGTGLAVSGGSLVLGTHTHDDRYYTETEVDSLLSGYATLVGGKVPASQLPSYVDDVVEVATFGDLPSPGETGKIYLVLATNKVYRWTGFVWLEIVASPGSTDSLAEGSVNLYYTNVRAAAAAPVQSVAGKTGAVVLAAGDIASGTLSASRLPIATANALGGVRIGSGVSIDHTTGVISVSGASVAWADISGKPSFATVATSGSYADLSNVPSSFTPSAHAASHAAGASDVLTPADIGAAAASHTHDGLTGANSFLMCDDNIISIFADGIYLNGSPIYPYQLGSTAGLLVKTGTSGVLETLAQGTAGQVLKVNSTATGVEWGAAAADVSIDTTAADVLSASSGSITADDPGADRIVFWDDSAGKLTHLEVGSGLSISGTTITAASAPTVASPSQITANQNDYAGATADINRITSDAARDITGIAAGTDGQAILLVNVGSFTITLKHQNTGSTAANRIIVPWAGDYVIPADGSATLVYDDTTDRWRVL